MAKLLNNPVVQKSLNRLKALGLNVKLYSDSEDEVYLLISLDSICKLIEKNITYQNRKVMIEGDQLVIYMWRRR